MHQDALVVLEGHLDLVVPDVLGDEPVAELGVGDDFHLLEVLPELVRFRLLFRMLGHHLFPGGLGLDRLLLLRRRRLLLVGLAARLAIRVHVPAGVALNSADLVLVLRDDDVLRIRLALGAVSLDLGPYLVHIVVEDELLHIASLTRVMLLAAPSTPTGWQQSKRISAAKICERGRRDARQFGATIRPVLDPDVVAGQRRRARMLLELGRTAEALAAIRRVLATHPNDPESLEIEGLCHLRRRDFRQALEVLGRAIASGPDVAHPHYLYGFALREAGRARRGARGRWAKRSSAARTSRSTCERWPS